MSDGEESSERAPKRKGAGEEDGVVPKTQKEEREDGGRQQRTPRAAEEGEDEVEEFFAILRRIQVAINYFRRGDGANARPLKMWRAMLEGEGDIADHRHHLQPRQAVKEVKRGGGGGEGEGVVAGLDLNADPDPVVHAERDQ